MCFTSGVDAKASSIFRFSASYVTCVYISSRLVQCSLDWAATLNTTCWRSPGILCKANRCSQRLSFYTPTVNNASTRHTHTHTPKSPVGLLVLYKHGFCLCSTVFFIQSTGRLQQCCSQLLFRHTFLLFPRLAVYQRTKLAQHIILS